MSRRTVEPLRVNVFLEETLARLKPGNDEVLQAFYLSGIVSLLDLGVQRAYIDLAQKEKAIVMLQSLKSQEEREAFFYFAPLYIIKIYSRYVEDYEGDDFGAKPGDLQYQFFLLCLLVELGLDSISRDRDSLCFSQMLYDNYRKLKTSSGGRWYPFPNPLKGERSSEVFVL